MIVLTIDSAMKKRGQLRPAAIPWRVAGATVICRLTENKAGVQPRIPPLLFFVNVHVPMPNDTFAQS